MNIVRIYYAFEHYSRLYRFWWSRIHCPFHRIFFCVWVRLCIHITHIYIMYTCLSIYRTFSSHYIAQIFLSLFLSLCCLCWCCFQIRKTNSIYSMVLFFFLFPFSFQHSSLTFSHFTSLRIFCPYHFFFICLHLLSCPFRMRCGSLFRQITFSIDNNGIACIEIIFSVFTFFSFVLHFSFFLCLFLFVALTLGISPYLSSTMCSSEEILGEKVSRVRLICGEMMRNQNQPGEHISLW